MEAKRYFCKHCEKVIEPDTEATVIVTGKLIGDEIDNIGGTYVFHDSCFVEIAGKEYYPGQYQEELVPGAKEWQPQEQC